MRVLTVSHEMPFFGGAEMVVAKLCSYMSKVGLENTLIAPNIVPELRASLNGTRLIETGTGSKLTMLRRLRAKVQDCIREADVVNVHNFPASLTVPPVKKPVVWLCNEPPEVFLNKPEPMTNHIARVILVKAGKYVAKHFVSAAVVADEFNAERFKALYHYEPYIIPYGVDHDFWSQGESRSSTNSFMMLQSGTVTPLKNQMASLRVVAKLKRAIPNLSLWFVGWMPDKAYLEELKWYIDSHKLRGMVYFLGAVDRLTLRSLYHKASIVIHPIKEQGGWLTPMEALCAGVPVVVSKACTASSIIQQQALGVVSEDDTLECSVLEIYGNQKHHQSKAQEAASWLRDNLSWRRFCESFVGLMQSELTRFITTRRR